MPTQPISFPVPLAPPPNVALGPIVGAQRVRDYALVLRSMGVACSVHEAGHGFVIVVAAEDQARAVESLRLYDAENRNWPPRRRRERLPYARTLVAPAVLALLVAFFFVTGPAASSGVWFERGAAVSSQILHGEPWRAVTALTLHADSMHVLGNALSGALFLSAASRRLGDGRALLATVMAGSLGNAANAFWHRHGEHASIGASTAVFAAVGILVATQLVLDGAGGAVRSRWERVAPVVGGAALLGMLGASPHSDLMAHFFGLVAGVVVGLGFALVSRGRPARHALVQIASGAAAAAIVGGSWALALR